MQSNDDREGRKPYRTYKAGRARRSSIDDELAGARPARQRAPREGERSLKGYQRYDSAPAGAGRGAGTAGKGGKPPRRRRRFRWWFVPVGLLLTLIVAAVVVTVLAWPGYKKFDRAVTAANHGLDKVDRKPRAQLAPDDGWIWRKGTTVLLLGVGEALVAPASLRWIGLHCTERERGLAIGVYMTGTKFGPALGTLLTASLITALNWRAAFLVLGLGGLIWLVFWMLVVRDDDHGDRRPATAQPAAPGTTLRQMLATRLLWGILIGTFAYNYFVFFCVTWLPVYLVERRNLSLNSMGLYTFFSFGGMATMAMLAGAVADRLIRRGGDPVRVRKAFTIAGLLLASTEVFGAYARTLPVALFFAIFSLVGLGLATANYWALTQTLIPGVALGRIAGVQNCASNLSGIAASLVTGWLKQATGGYEVPMQTMWVMLLIGLAAYIFLVKPAPLTRTSSP